jgi:hypothetical protein
MTHGLGELSEKGSGNYPVAQLFLWHFTKLKVYLIYWIDISAFLQKLLPQMLILCLSEEFCMFK